MARKIHIDSDNTIQQWIDSQNTMSDYMGDLDDFVTEIRTTPLNYYGDYYLEKIADSGLYDTYRPGYRDSSFVTAVNHVYNPMGTFLTPPNPTTYHQMAYCRPGNGHKIAV